MRIYVASSWRNEYQPAVVADLRKGGHEVYDFRNPPGGGHGFHWSAIDPKWRLWSPELFVEALDHPIARAGFASDYEALRWADCCVLVLPCGRSAHIEAGWLKGSGKPTYVLHSPDDLEPELMYLLCDQVFTDIRPLLEGLAAAAGTRRGRAGGPAQGVAAGGGEATR